MKKQQLKTLWHLFAIFFKAGTFTFAGGLAMLPVIERDVVDTYAMMNKDEFIEYATLAQSLPGVIALNCACFVGKHAAGIAGMLAAGIGSTISAFVLMIAATILLQSVPQSGPVMGAFIGIRAASSALILSAAFSLGRHNIKSTFSIVIMLSCFALVLFAHVSAPVIILAAGVIGYFFERYKERCKEAQQ